MKKMKDRLKSVFRVFWSNKYRLVCVVLLLCLLLGSFHYVTSSNQATVELSFNYAEASSGLNPNKTRFNAYEILSDTILERAIELAGLKDHVTAEQLSGCLRLSPVDTGNASGDDNYICTTYRISLDAGSLDLKNVKVTDMLKSVCKAYRSYFLENYCDNQEILKTKLEVTTDSEPYLRINELKLRVKQLTRYLSARVTENKSFTDEDTGNNFTEMDKRLTNIVNYDIPNATAYIIESGVSKDPAMLTSILEYKNKIDSMTAEKDMAYYNADKAGIKMYEKSMTSIVMIPTTDELDEYYMSRTKTAMDRMARSADAALEEATDYKQEIVDTSYVIDKMKKSKTGAQKLASAREMINKLENALNDLSEDLFVLDKAYIDYKARNYITFNYAQPSFTQRINLKKTAMEVAGVLVVGFVVCYMRVGRKEKKAHEKV